MVSKVCSVMVGQSQDNHWGMVPCWHTQLFLELVDLDDDIIFLQIKSMVASLAFSQGFIVVQTSVLIVR